MSFFSTYFAVKAAPTAKVTVIMVIPTGPVRAKGGKINAKENRAIFKAPLVKIGMTTFLALIFIFCLLILMGKIHSCF